MPKPLVIAENVHKRFGNLEVLRDISLSVEEGEVVVLIGPSGSGKTTFLRCINLLVPIDRGSIRVDDDIITQVEQDGSRRQLPERDVNLYRSHIGMVFQHFNLFPHLKVLENITIGPRVVKNEPRDVAERRAHELLLKVGLPDKAQTMPATLSGGQKQRVAIVRALAMQPRVMLFDEPTSALDPETVGEVLAVMRQLAKEGMTMIIASHEMSFAHEVADRIVFMEHGGVVESGRPADLLVQPRSERLRRFLRQLSGDEVNEDG
jgi:polar amino acid transport system ATP-binding protein